MRVCKVINPTHVVFKVNMPQEPIIDKNFVCKECKATYTKPYLLANGCKICNGSGLNPNDRPVGRYSFIVPVNHFAPFITEIADVNPMEFNGTLDLTNLSISLAMADYKIESAYAESYEDSYEDKFEFAGMEEGGVAIGKLKDTIPRETLEKYTDNIRELLDYALEHDKEIVILFVSMTYV